MGLGVCPPPPRWRCASIRMLSPDRRAAENRIPPSCDTIISTGLNSIRDLSQGISVSTISLSDPSLLFRRTRGKPASPHKPVLPPFPAPPDLVKDRDYQGLDAGYGELAAEVFRMILSARIQPTLSSASFRSLAGVSNPGAGHSPANPGYPVP